MGLSISGVGVQLVEEQYYDVLTQYRRQVYLVGL